MKEKIKKIIIPASIAVICLFIGFSAFYFYQTSIELTSDVAADKAAKFINENFLPEGSEISLIDVAEADSVYKMIFEISGTEYTSYVSKDGKYLFPEGYVLETEEVLTEANNVQEKESLTGEQLESLAKCLTEKGDKFYGASWCSWCEKEKEVFADAAQYLPYVECIDPETQENTVECQDAGIESFPTWEISGEKTTGYKTPQELSSLSGCQI